MNEGIIIRLNGEEALALLVHGNRYLVKKWIPFNDYKGWVYVYIDQHRPFFAKNKDSYELTPDAENALNGKIIMRFWFEHYEMFNTAQGNPRIYVPNQVDDKYYLYKYGACDMYAWQITRTEIFETPLELEDFTYARGDKELILTKVPKLYRFVKLQEVTNGAPKF